MRIEENKSQIGPQMTECIDSQPWARDYGEKKKKRKKNEKNPQKIPFPSTQPDTEKQEKKKIGFFIWFSFFFFFQEEVLENKTFLQPLIIDLIEKTMYKVRILWND